MSSCMREHDRRREVDRPPRDVRDDQIAIDVLDEEIDEDRAQSPGRAGAEADRDHQHARNDRADIGDEGQQAGDQARAGRPSARRRSDSSMTR